MAAPAIDAVRTWIQVPVTVMPDELLQPVIDAEVLLQAKACTVGAELTADLVQAIYRRVAREVAARGVPLGILGADSEFGPTRLSSFDAEISRLEGPYRKVVFG